MLRFKAQDFSETLTAVGAVPTDLSRCSVGQYRPWSGSLVCYGMVLVSHKLGPGSRWLFAVADVEGEVPQVTARLAVVA